MFGIGGDKKKKVLVKTYRKTKEYERDANKLARDGWRVQGSPVEQKLGRGAFIQASSRKLVVTYVRD
jgi:hypothetical protein